MNDIAVWAVVYEDGIMHNHYGGPGEAEAVAAYLTGFGTTCRVVKLVPEQVKPCKLPPTPLEAAIWSLRKEVELLRAKHAALTKSFRDMLHVVPEHYRGLKWDAAYEILCREADSDILSQKIED